MVAVRGFTYLVDRVSAGGGCEVAVSATENVVRKEELCKTIHSVWE